MQVWYLMQRFILLRPRLLHPLLYPFLLPRALRQTAHRPRVRGTQVIANVVIVEILIRPGTTGYLRMETIVRIARGVKTRVDAGGGLEGPILVEEEEEGE
jgi:hypothetical protein